MSLEAGELNKYNEVKVFPTVDLTFWPKRLSDSQLQRLTQ